MIARTAPLAQPSAPRMVFPLVRDLDRRTVDSLSSRQVRPQQSMAAMPSRDRDRSQPPPSAQSRQRLQRIDTNTRSGANRRELDSLTSASSGGSSFMDRMKSGGSSRTSWEEDRKPVPEATSKSQDYNNDAPISGHGQTLWERLANAAGTLNIDVGKAWVATLTVQPGEETPPNQESRLTRAMKAYHLAKARNPTDLPEWLFEDHERRTHGRVHSITSNGDAERRPSTTTTHSRGLRGVYDAASTSSPSVRPNANPTRSRLADEHAMYSKATNRLNALRDARRYRGGSDDNYPMDNNYGTSNRAGRATSAGNYDLGVHPPPKSGLPTGPRRM
ncbi:hypothetical protein FIBSPDRAFT_1041965 [Athelia psychrophila]|uniref:Mso1 N-terminal domain-containing protein n=1 Tax=Athelia psychrophila TaxID=1759441 RepID=A0A166NBZ6_9AGAM|nr:hypothetical protein FIBSPDRAFT_1041965 [Fibularhizoctonia sp. CBS 109695]